MITGSRIRLGALVLAIAVAGALVTVFALALSSGPHQSPAAITEPTPIAGRSEPPPPSTQADATVDAATPTNDLTTYYPVVDGYRDRIKTNGDLREPGSVVVEAWNVSTDTKLWTSLPFESASAGAYSVTWNGESTGDVVVPAGTYRFRHVVTDAHGNTTTLSSPTFAVSHRTIVWHTFSTTTIQGKAFERTILDGGGTARTSTSRYRGGIRLDSGDGHAALIYKVHLSRVATPSNAVIRKLIFTINGKGAADVGMYDRTLGTLDLPGSYDELLTTAATPGWHPASTYRAAAHLVGKDAYGRVEAHGTFDISLVKVTLRYAVLR